MDFSGVARATKPQDSKTRYERPREYSSGKSTVEESEKDRLNKKENGRERDRGVESPEQC